MGDEGRNEFNRPLPSHGANGGPDDPIRVVESNTDSLDGAGNVGTPNLDHYETVSCLASYYLMIC